MRLSITGWMGMVDTRGVPICKRTSDESMIRSSYPEEIDRIVNNQWDDCHQICARFLREARAHLDEDLSGKELISMICSDRFCNRRYNDGKSSFTLPSERANSDYCTSRNLIDFMMRLIVPLYYCPSVERNIGFQIPPSYLNAIFNPGMFGASVLHTTAILIGVKHLRMNNMNGVLVSLKSLLKPEPRPLISESEVVNFYRGTDPRKCIADAVFQIRNRLRR